MKQLSKETLSVLDVFNKTEEWVSNEFLCENTSLTIMRVKGYIVELQARGLVESKIENKRRYYRKKVD